MRKSPRRSRRTSQHQRGGRPAAGHAGNSAAAASQQALHLPAVHPGRQISWQQVSLALGSLVVGTITSASINTDHGNGTGPIIVMWIAITFINGAIFRVGRASRRDRRSPD